MSQGKRKAPTAGTPRRTIKARLERQPAEESGAQPRAAMTDKERAEALKAEGNAFLKEKDYARAEDCYTEAIALDSTVEAYYTNRSLARTNLGKYDEAVDDCMACLKVNPRSARAYGRMGSAQFKAGRYTKSVEAYEAALQIDPGNDTYRQGLEAASAQENGGGSARASHGDGPDDAVSQLQSILKAAAAGSTKAQVKSVHEASADMSVGMARSARAMNLFNEIKADYESELSRVSTDAEREAVLDQLHERSAPKVLALARNNGGIYNKAAQFVASLQGGAGDKGVPRAYVKALAVLTDGAPFKDFSAMEPVLVEEFGRQADALFKSIDRTPIAAASLAQVHRAVTKEGESVAVKLLYPALRKEMASDFAGGCLPACLCFYPFCHVHCTTRDRLTGRALGEVFRMVGAQIKPAGFDLQWLVKDFEVLAAPDTLTPIARLAQARAARLVRPLDGSWVGGGGGRWEAACRVRARARRGAFSARAARGVGARCAARGPRPL